MLCEGKGSLGEGFFDYSAGVPRDGVEKTSFGMKNCTLLIEKYNIGAQNRKWNQNESENCKMTRNFSEMEPKIIRMEPKGTKMEPKGPKREPKGAQMEPQGSQK